ncbi:riboflavin synthase [Futiania mangrovi]|uniref:Riboflavin synthase n=1 Tax=Futiania mangrovi TaxID=2959716 RepID=A0A9J6PE30_9PROT|nr:riboflavin synthase [Futiania mangrovii]MCP1336080.1 riboflavin synthase [Futiania mangrovii]
MFTGLITDVGEVVSLEQRGDTRVRIACGYEAGGIEIGASIACNGACLTVVAKGRENGRTWFDVDVSAETLSKTSLGTWAPGSRVNLERSLKVGDEIGGHIVSGHVDGTAEVVSIAREGDSIRYRFRVPAGLKKFIAPKGSVALDGVSLTVNEVEDDVFGVNIIPHTQARTTFGTLSEGARVNLEADVLARYVARLTELTG